MADPSQEPITRSAGIRTFEEAVSAHQGGRVLEATRAYRRLAAELPGHADALHLLGVALAQLGATRSGAATILRALRLRPDHAEAWGNYAGAVALTGASSEAAAGYRRAAAGKPDYPDTLSYFGNLAVIAGDADAGSRWFRRLLAVAPDFPQARFRLGLALKRRHRWDAAIVEFVRLLERDPENGRAEEELGQAYAIQGKLSLAALHGRRSIALAPASSTGHGAFASICSLLNASDVAIREYLRTLSIWPDDAETHTKLIFAKDYVSNTEIAEQQRERRLWYVRHGRRLSPASPVRARDPAPERRLRIGYVSADFCHHSAAFVFGPAVLNHDRAGFEVTLYSGVEIEDAMTARFRAVADRFRSTVGVTDDRMATLVREDEIDILVDLSGFSGGNRLLVFARKPAPIQVSAWGHATATGMDTIDYFFADPVFVPPSVRPHFAERIFDLPCFGAYMPDLTDPPVAPPPVSRGSPLTFGCLNRLQKLSAPVVDLWGRLLRDVPGSRLLLKDQPLANAPDRERIIGEFRRRGISADRLMLRGRTPHFEHMATFGEVDVALDPFPHNGGVSTFEALWMGVPVVTKAGVSMAGRLGAAILSALDFQGWVAESDQDYLEIAKRLAGDRDELARLRKGMRPMLASSVVYDSPRYCRAVESAYREMWRRYCREVA